MKYVRPRIDQAEALRLFQRHWMDRWRRRLAGFLPGTQGPVWERGPFPFIECVWLPYYLITFQLLAKAPQKDVTLSVEGYSGTAVVIQIQGDMTEEVPKGESFPPKLSEAEAIALARKGLMAAILRQRGKSRRPIPGEVVALSQVYYPYWVYYFRRRRNCIDVRILDAVSGARPGSKTKYAILGAFQAAADRS